MSKSKRLAIDKVNDLDKQSQRKRFRAKERLDSLVDDMDDIKYIPNKCMLGHMKINRDRKSKFEYINDDYYIDYKEKLRRK